MSFVLDVGLAGERCLATFPNSNLLICVNSSLHVPIQCKAPLDNEVFLYYVRVHMLRC